MSSMIADLRHGLRLLRRSPGFSAVAVLVLALGIGVNVGVFSVVNTLVLQPRPGRIDSLVTVFNRDRNKPAEYHGFSYGAYVDLRDRSDIFDSVLAQGFTTLGVREGDLTRQAFGAVVSANYFETLGVTLAAGRPFTLDEERGAAPTTVAIASYGLWRRHTLDPQFIGSRVRINGSDYTVVGVAPKGFGGTTALVSPQWWLPLGAYDRVVNEAFRESAHGIQSRDNYALLPTAALKPGITREQANARLDAFSRQLNDAYPASDKDRIFFTGSVSRMNLSTRPRGDGPIVGLAALLMLMALLVLAVACLNLANLLLARGVARRKEIAIRLALGSGRGRIVQQLVAEGVTLAALGASAGLFAGWWTSIALGAWLTNALTFGLDVLVSPSPRLIAAAGAFAVISTILFAVGPAWSLSGAHATDDLKGDRGGARRRGIGPLLVASQLAVSLALVAAAGLFTRGAINVASIDGGFPMAHQLVVGMDTGLAGYDEARTRSTYAAVLEHVRALAGVESASLASTVVFGDLESSARVRTAPTDSGIDAASDVIAARYFETLGARVVRGREFNDSEDHPAAPSTNAGPAVINRRLATMLFKDADPIGRPVLVQSRPGDAPQSFTVVGIAPDLRQELFQDEPPPHVYLPLGIRFSSMMTLHVRTASGVGDAAMLGTIRRTLETVDPQLPVLSAKTLAAQRDTSIDVWAVHAGATLFFAFGALALVLAAIGVYGLKAYDVSRRTREIGIRVALGATSGDVKRLLVAEGARTAAAGLAAGVLLAAGVGKLASGYLFNVSPFDPVILAAAAAVLIAAALLASYVPARRATRVAPLDALRSE